MVGKFNTMKLLHSLWLRMTSLSQDGSTPIQDILASQCFYATGESGGASSILINVSSVTNTLLLSECIQVWTLSAVIDLVWCHSICMDTWQRGCTHLLQSDLPLLPQMSSSCITNTPISRQNLQMFYHIKSQTDSLHRFINTNCPAFMKRHYQ